MSSGQTTRDYSEEVILRGFTRPEVDPGSGCRVTRHAWPDSDCPASSFFVLKIVFETSPKFEIFPNVQSCEILEVLRSSSVEDQANRDWPAKSLL